MPERFRGELLTMGRYTNPASFPFTFSEENESQHVSLWASEQAPERFTLTVRYTSAKRGLVQMQLNQSALAAARHFYLSPVHSIQHVHNNHGLRRRPQTNATQLYSSCAGRDTGNSVKPQVVFWAPDGGVTCTYVQGGAKKRGHPISLQIFWKFHNRIAWKLVNFYNIICWIQSLTSCLKISSRCGAT